LTQSTASELIGQQPTKEDAEAVTVLCQAHFKGFTTKSDFARTHADTVAMLTRCGLISTEIGRNTWTNIFKITAEGLQYLEDLLEEVPYETPIN
jgi:hypothetical protein|tara:strand:- start:3942 stop:4223 length:282 start_codon:yes stop_codon:yes gene_type:complete